MLRKSFVALAAVAALVTFTVVEASARSGGGHGGRGYGGSGFHRGMGGGPRMHMGGGYRGGGFVNRGYVNRGFVNRGFGPRYGHRPFAYRPYGFRPYYAPRFRYYGAPYAYYGGYNSCYRWRRVWTPYGLQMRRVWVCGYRRYY